MSVNKTLQLLLLCFFSLLTTWAISQKKERKTFDKQISFSHENDAFALRGTDGYYTSGLFAAYSTIKKENKPGIIKTLYDFEIGQKIFTPGIREVFVITELDRPITGYLYGGFSITHFKQKNRLFKLGISIGTVGSSALGKEVLDLIHPLLKIRAEWWDWMFDYQIKNEMGINAHGSYGFSIIPQSNASLFQVTPVSNVTLGTSFTNIRQSVLLQFGRQNAMYESGFWNTRLENKGSSAPKYKKEIFAYFQPEIMYQLYNATVQGGMFRSDKGRIISKNKPFVITNKVGVMYAAPRYSAGFHLTFQTKEAKSQETNHIFGGVQFAYRFR